MCVQSQTDLDDPLSGSELMALFRSYFDESGKFKDHRVISFCGVVASPETLSDFNNAWDALLRKHQMPSLHTTQALRFRRDLSPIIRKESAHERCESLKPFVDCILQNLDLGIFVSLDVTAYSKWSPGAKKRVGGSDDPAYFAFLQASMAMKLYACRDEDRISVICDDCEDTALNFYQLYRHFKKVDPVLRKKLVCLSFADDSLYPGLQAADLLASLVRMESLRRFGYHTHEFGPLVEHLIKGESKQRLKWCGLIGDEETMGDLNGQLERVRIRPRR